MIRRPGGGRGRDADPDDDVRREIRAHLEMSAEELEGRGLDAAAAREEARRMFGDEERAAREAARFARHGDLRARFGRALESVRQDVGYAARSLLRSPTFAVVAIVTLALGIGANATLFSIVRGSLLRPLPFDEPHELVWINETRDGGSGVFGSAAWQNVVDWREQARGFEGIAPFTAGTSLVLGGERPARVGSAWVGEDFWRVFAPGPVQGRVPAADEHRFGATPVAVVSQRYWETELGSRPLDDITLEVGGQVVQVVGVLPRTFDYPAGTELWAPAELFDNGTDRTAHNWRVAGRLADGVSLEAASDELDQMTRNLVAGSEPSEYLAEGARAIPLREALVGDAGRPLLLLFGAAGFVLLVACTNLAGTLLARGATRERELAVRTSLGAGRARLARQLLTESAVLATLGAAAGLALALPLVRTLVTLAPAAVPRLGDVRVDGAVLAFTAAAAAATALLCGLLPALRLTRAGAGDALRGGRGIAVGGRSPLWRVLVGTEVALALVLLTGSGLLVRSFREVLAEPPGFDASDVTGVDVGLGRIEYATPEDHARFYGELIGRLEALPGVTAAGVANAAPLMSFAPNGQVELDGNMEALADGVYITASPGYFDAIDLEILRGRPFDEREHGAGTALVALVSESFAERYWPGEDAIGRQVTGGGMDDRWESREFSTVIGVVEDARHSSLAEAPEPTIYFPYGQRPFRLQFGADVVVETADGVPAGLGDALRSVVADLESDAVVQLEPLSGTVAASLADRRFPMLVMGGFALLALLLALVGIYGVVSYGVARRSKEMGIRLALGAEVGRVRGMVVKETGATVIGGLIVGTAGALLVARLLGSLLYGVSPTDPLTFVATAAAVLAAALLASWIPARAGTRVDPVVTLRSE